MKGSGTIQVLKRSGITEPFRIDLLGLCMWRAMHDRQGRFAQATQLAEAITIHLSRNGCHIVTSRALLEMALRALRQTHHDLAADALEAHHRRRRAARRSLILVHDAERRSHWDRDWLTEQIRRRWSVSRAAARAISAEIERELLGRDGPIARDAVLSMVDRRVEEYGLAPWCLLTSAPNHRQGAERK